MKKSTPVAILLALVAVLAQADDGDNAIRDAATLYASFDEAVVADYGAGERKVSTRYDHPSEKDKFEFEAGYPRDAFSIDAKAGVHGGALQASKVLQRRGRIFFPAERNIAFKQGGWGGTVSLWINTDPNTLIKTPFCDPVQLTQRGANNGGLWIDFPDVNPRDMRMGAFPAVAEGQMPLLESDPAAPLVTLKGVNFKDSQWHHLAITWQNFDTGRPDAVAIFYVDGKEIGRLKELPMAMKWELDKAGLYVAVNYIGLLDEFAIFDRPLTEAEVGRLKAEPGLLAALKNKNKEPPKAPAFPFKAKEAHDYQQAYARWLGIPVRIANAQGMQFVLIPPGKFLMGSPEKESGHNANGFDEARHEVTLTQPFYLARCETTFGEFRRFVEETKYVTDGERNGGGHAHDELAEWKHRAGVSWSKPGYVGPFELSNRHPVVQVSQADATAYCEWLNSRETVNLHAKIHYRLPTEAQWEWACRAGSGERYWWGADDDSTGKRLNAGDAALKRTHPKWPREAMAMDDGYAYAASVGSYAENAFGLCDMLGNVWEFCSTRSGPPPKGPVVDPQDADEKRGFAVRGGGWSNVPADVRCAVRNADPPHFCHSNLGFRVALELPPAR